MATTVACFVLFATTAADLSTSMFGRRVKGNAVRRLRLYDKQGLAGRSVAGATIGVILLITSQVVPVAALIDGVNRDQPPRLVTGAAEIIGAIAVVIVVARGTAPDSIGDQGGPRDA